MAHPAKLLAMSHGDIVITRHKGPRDTREAKPRPVANPATIALCSARSRTGEAISRANSKTSKLFSSPKCPKSVIFSSAREMTMSDGMCGDNHTLLSGPSLKSQRSTKSLPDRPPAVMQPCGRPLNPLHPKQGPSPSPTPAGVEHRCCNHERSLDMHMPQ